MYSYISIRNSIFHENTYRTTGGDGKIGTVDSVQNYRTDGKERNAVKVTWPNKENNMYKLGYRGKVDVICVEEVPGMDYYRDHLFPLSKLLNRFEEISEQYICM